LLLSLQPFLVARLPFPFFPFSQTCNRLLVGTFSSLLPVSSPFPLDTGNNPTPSPLMYLPLSFSFSASFQQINLFASIRRLTRFTSPRYASRFCPCPAGFVLSNIALSPSSCACLTDTPVFVLPPQTTCSYTTSFTVSLDRNLGSSSS